MDAGLPSANEAKFVGKTGIYLGLQMVCREYVNCDLWLSLLKTNYESIRMPSETVLGFREKEMSPAKAKGARHIAGE